MKTKSFIVCIVLRSILSNGIAFASGEGVFMKEIKLTKGFVTQVDDEDYEWLSQWKWCYKDGYAHRGMKNVSGKWTTVLMHRIIMMPPNTSAQVDHIDGDGLNNQKQNLRLCTNAQNRMNSMPNKNTLSKYKGVTQKGGSKLWCAQIRHDQKTRNLGYFKSEHDAAIRYNEEAAKLFGEFAKLNKIKV